MGAAYVSGPPARNLIQLEIKHLAFSSSLNSSGLSTKLEDVRGRMTQGSVGPRRSGSLELPRCRNVLCVRPYDKLGSQRHIYLG